MNDTKYFCKWCDTIIDQNKVKRKLLDIKNGKSDNMFCGLSCCMKFRRNLVTLNIQKQYLLNPIRCKHCDDIIPYKKSRLKLFDVKRSHTKYIFCSRSCAASYNNTHKTHGTRVSKLERWMAEKLTALHPSLEIHYNRKDAINSELDIYIPSLKLAFELNGPFHYEPIFSEEQLKSIQNNDQRKLQACLERGIELCVIDTSKHSYVKESTCKPYLDIVLQIIELKRAQYWN
jgi:hypothetical protein